MGVTSILTNGRTGNAPLLKYDALRKRINSLNAGILRRWSVIGGIRGYLLTLLRYPAERGITWIIRKNEISSKVNPFQILRDRLPRDALGKLGVVCSFRERLGSRDIREHCGHIERVYYF